MHEAVRPTIGYRDARKAIRFLVEAFGFIEDVVHDGDDPALIYHAALRWPGGGLVFLHSAAPGDSSITDLAERAAQDGGYPAFSIHLDVDDPDPIYERAVAAGAEVVRPLQDSPLGVGTRGFIVRDPEGLYWSFGTPLPPLVKGDDGTWRPASGL
jgi:uncharacterized glyoxalase superfamily protein PhnB